MRLAAIGRWAVLALATAHAALSQDQNQNQGNGNGGNGNGNNNGASSSASASSVSASGSQTPTPTSSGAGSVMATTTTITSVWSQNGGPTTATFVLTLTVPGPSSSAAPNATMSNNGTLAGNGTDGLNGTMTNSTAEVWNDTMSYLPFTPHLDPAFGIGGAVLILTGIPVATLGGKNRWSALAIVSGYSVALFCLIIILSFGVSPALEPPSPHPPSTAMRGLFLLAVGISCLIGAGLGIFFYTFAKYWVGAAGGFALGWYLLALRKGGLVTNVGGRWAIVGGLTVLALFLSMMPKLHEYVLLVASAWIGATAFTLGIDCFTRAGLKEFYIYNLGYQGLFPSLNGGKYPHTQSMQVELGVIAAAALIAGAIQFKIVKILKKRRNTLKEQEEARIEAAEVAKAAENFKNVDAELAEWEGKHGTPPSGLNTLPNLAFDSNPTSMRTLVSNGQQEMLVDGQEGYAPVRGMGVFDDIHEKEPSSPSTPSDPELESKLQLLADVRRARQSIRSSMDQLRSSANTPTMDAAASVHGSVQGMMDRAGSPGSYHHSRHNSATSSRLLDDMVRQRHDSTTSSRMLDDMVRTRGDSMYGDNLHVRRDSASFLDSPRRRHDSLGSRTFQPADRRPSSVALSERLSMAEPRPSSLVNDPRPSLDPRNSFGGRNSLDPRGSIVRNSSDARPVSEWDAYVQNRTVVAPSPSKPAPNDFAVISGGVARALSKREERTSATLQRTNSDVTPGQEYGASLARHISLEQQKSLAAKPAPRRRESTERTRPARAMTKDELEDRHRDMLGRLQDKVTAPLREEEAVAKAREQWNALQREERAEQRRKEKERSSRVPKAERGDTARGVAAVSLDSTPGASERARRTDEWRRSVAGPNTPPKATPASATTPSRPAASTARTPVTRRTSKAYIA